MASKQHSASHRHSARGSSATILPGSPYYIRGLDENSVKVSQVLSESRNNYHKWYREMMVKMATKINLGFVNGTIKVPSTDNIIEYEAWKKCNKLILSWILKSVSPNIAGKVREKGYDKAAHVLWSYLKNRYSPGDAFIISGLKDEIHSLRQLENEKVTSYYEKFSLLWQELEVLWPLPECTCRSRRDCSCDALRMQRLRWQDKLGSFLRGLHGRFNATRLQIMRQDTFRSLEQVHIYLVREERQMDNRAKAQLSLMQHRSQHSSSSKHAYASKPSTGKEVIGIKKLVLPIHLHPHPLTSNPPGAPYMCSGCKEPGFGRSYRCENSRCGYVLHEECANAVLYKSNVRHSFFNEEQFSLLEKPLSRDRVCDACRKEVRGFVYHRPDNGRPDDTGLDLHPCCFKLKHSISYKERDVTVTLKLCRTIPKKCVKCKSREVGDENKVKGWSYITSGGDCYHVSCFKELILGKLKEGYFSEKRMSVNKYDTKTTKLPQSSGKEIVKVGGSSSGSVAIKIVSKIAPVVFKLIFSAIFGNPVSFVLGLVEALATITSS